MRGVQVQVVGECEFHRGDSDLVSLRCFFEYFVATRVFKIKHQPAVADRLMASAVERKGARVNGLAWLVNRLLGCQEDRGFVFEPYLLRKLGGSDGAINHVPQLIASDHSGGEPKLRFGRASPI